MSKQSFIRRFLSVLCLIVFIEGSSAWAHTTHEVLVVDNAFMPSSLTIAPGDTVRWVNAAGGAPHDVTSNTNAWTASATATSFTSEVTFNDSGSFNYRCTIHSLMTGIVTVETAAAAAELEVQAG